MHATSVCSITNLVSISELALQSKQSHCISFQSLLQPILQGGTESCTVRRISPMLTNSIFLKMDSAKILSCSYQDLQLMTPCTIQTNIKISISFRTHWFIDCFVKVSIIKTWVWHVSLWYINRHRAHKYFQKYTVMLHINCYALWST